ncbi:hypothetical protein BCR42DRAFT_469303 [Absidia repens]|uniref:Uncharacterized protein n=1 Tax=Absidia repens TaxID=90262 RepID=A0A1X2I8C7_9FUNG|nr:hypothetical protein BCR42DRAFT_469303 [Absidia repens]
MQFLSQHGSCVVLHLTKLDWEYFYKMSNAFGQIDPAAFALAIIGTIWAIEQGLAGFANNWTRRYNIRVLRTIQSSYDQTDLLRPLRRKNHDMSSLSVTLLCAMMVTTFNISSDLLRMGITLCLFAQHANFSLVKILFLGLANMCLRLHVWDLHHDDVLRKPCRSWAFDLEWSELTVKMAIRELCNPGLFGDDLLMILYEVAQFKSGPLACKLPIDDNVTTTSLDDEVSLGELLVAAFALYNVEGSQVIERHDIDVLGLATVTFEQVNPDNQSLVFVSLTIREVLLQFSVNATMQCHQGANCASNAAYLIQYAAATGNRWLLSASMDCIDDKVESNSPYVDDLKNMAYAAGCAIAINHYGKVSTDIQTNPYCDWIHTNFIYRARLPWCQHHTSPRRCHCWLTHFLIMSPETATRLYGANAKRNIIVVAKTEEEGAHVLQSVTGTAAAFVRLSSQSQILTNSTQFRRAKRIVLAGATQ